MNEASNSTGYGKRLAHVPTGIAGLDVILRGGLLQGGITIVQGRPGAGKTILANQMCFAHAAAGGRVLYVTLLAENLARMLMHVGNLSFFRDEVIPDRMSLISAFSVIESDGLRGLLGLLRKEVMSFGATLLVLDGLIAAETAAESSLQFKKFVHELQTQAATSGCNMLLLTTGRESADNATAEHTMVDCVIELRSRLNGWRAERDLEVLKRRGEGFLRGRHAFRISDAGLTVFPRTEALLAKPSRTERRDGKREGFGLPGLDAMFDGGLPRASSTMLIGPTGCGKTSLGLHFLNQCSAEHPGLFVSLYETQDNISAKSRQFGLALADHLEQGHVRFEWQPPTEGLLDELCMRMLDDIRARGVRRLLLDGIGGLIKLATEPDRMSHILTALVNELRALEVTTIFTRETEDMLGGVGAWPATKLESGSVSDIAENIVLLQFMPLRTRMFRAVTAFKVRDSRVDDQRRLFEITNRGIVVDVNADRAETVWLAANGTPGQRLPGG